MISLLGLVSRRKLRFDSLNMLSDCVADFRYVPASGFQISLGSTAAFSAFTGVATLSLGFSYGVPIALSLFQGRRQMRSAPFSLSKFGMAINIITIIWILLASVIFCMPTAIADLSAESMNYACVGEYCLCSSAGGAAHCRIIRLSSLM